MSNAKNLWIKNILCTIAIPVFVWMVMELICKLGMGVSVINSIADMKNLGRTLASTFCVALALSCNITSGRMDLSLGAQVSLAAIIGGNIALSLGLGGIGVLLFSIGVGLLAGLVVGFLFIKLKILPMILGIGMTLIYECIAFLSFNSSGLRLFGIRKVSILSDLSFIMAVMVVLILIMSYVFQYSQFGFDHRAIRGSQRIAHSSGINIFKNAVICYILAGGLVACSGVFNAAYAGQLMPELGMSSNARIFSNMFPMFLGLYIGRWSNPVVGIFFSSLALKIFGIGIAKFPIDISIQTLISVTMFLLFLIFQNNEYRIRSYKQKQKRISEAKKMRLELNKI